jgi:hypothetical protein
MNKTIKVLLIIFFAMLALLFIGTLTFIIYTIITVL